jgi:hypothetical protein
MKRCAISGFMVCLFCCFRLNYGAKSSKLIPKKQNNHNWMKKALPDDFRYHPIHHIQDDNDDYDIDSDSSNVKPFSEVWFPMVYSIVTTIYGTILLFYSPNASGQIHVLTMFRVTGQRKLEQAWRAFRRNLWDVRFAILRRAPTFLLARRSLWQFKNRIQHHRRLVQETRQAKADGVITAQEARRVTRLQKQEIRNIKRDIQRLFKVTSTVGALFQALDMDEILDIIRNVMFQFLAVLATNHEGSALSSVISSWCLFLNLGSLSFELDRKLDFPIAQYIIRCIIRKGTPNPGIIRNTGKFLMFGISAYIVRREKILARRFNAALVSSAVIMRGLNDFVSTMVSWDDDDDDGIWPEVGRFLRGRSGGVCIISWTAIGMIVGPKLENGDWVAPNWILRPLNATEHWIHQLAVVADKIV